MLPSIRNIPFGIYEIPWGWLKIRTRITFRDVVRIFPVLMRLHSGSFSVFASNFLIIINYCSIVLTCWISENWFARHLFNACRVLMPPRKKYWNINTQKSVFILFIREAHTDTLTHVYYSRNVCISNSLLRAAPSMFIPYWNSISKKSWSIFCNTK